MTKVVTFYSYKGGVGRTMALVNVAHVLARDGWRVLMVDFDLEAPGMTHFFAKEVRERPETVKHDALDLLLHARTTINWDPIEKRPKPLEIPKSLAEYVVSIPLPDEWKDKVIPYRTGRLDLLPATLDPVEPEEAPGAEPSRNYLRRMDELDLQGIFDVGGPRHWFGDHVRHYFVNARFKATGDILFTLRKKVWAAYDLVLVDSRTGLNEVAGLCIGPLCDALVICCGLNDQSIYGTKYFMKKAGLFDRDKAKPYTLVAGPVPIWHTREADERIALLRKELRCETVTEIPYHPAAALVEKKFVLDEPNEPITQTYERLAPAVAGLASAEGKDGLDQRAGELLACESDETDAWSGINREVARSLSGFRLASQLRRFPRMGLLALFPRAACAASLPTRELPEETGRGWDLLPFAAAVAAYPNHSDRPFQRAWRLLPQCAFVGLRQRLGVRLIFMQLRVNGTLPTKAIARRLLESVCCQESDNASGRGVYIDEPGQVTDLHMTLRSFSAHEAKWSPEGMRGVLHPYAPYGDSRFPSLADESLLTARAPWWAAIKHHRFGEAFRLAFEAAQTLAAKTPMDKEGAGLATLVEALPLTGRIQGMRLGATGSLRWAAQTMVHGLRPPYEMRNWVDIPLGFWFEPLMASAVALVKGQEGAKEVIGWLTLARVVYGYAWRVLVDWRHLESVKDHPLFVEFIGQEDEMVDEIESAIDRGEYTL